MLLAELDKLVGDLQEHEQVSSKLNPPDMPNASICSFQGFFSPFLFPLVLAPVCSPAVAVEGRVSSLRLELETRGALEKLESQARVASQACAARVVV